MRFYHRTQLKKMPKGVFRNVGCVLSAIEIGHFSLRLLQNWKWRFLSFFIILINVNQIQHIPVRKNSQYWPGDRCWFNFVTLHEMAWSMFCDQVKLFFKREYRKTVPCWDYILIERLKGMLWRKRWKRWGALDYSDLV